MAESELIIKISSEQAERAARNLERSLKQTGKAGDKAARDLKKTEKQARQTGKAFDTLLAAAAGFLGLNFAKDVFDTTASFESLTLSLKTVTGSLDNAKGAFNALNQFAKQTPFTLDQSVKAFQQLTVRGLAPTERTLKSFGDTATALGRDMTDFVNAVANATTGEFESLKTFGIKAKKDGDNIKVIFKGVEKSIKNDIESIQEYMVSLGETEFKDAMVDQMLGIQGAAVNLEDSFNRLKNEIGETFKGEILQGTNFTADLLSSIQQALPNFRATVAGLTVVLVSEFETAWDNVKILTLELVNQFPEFTKMMAKPFAVLFDWILEAYGTTISAIGDAADFVGLDGLSKSLNAIGNDFTIAATNAQELDQWFDRGATARAADIKGLEDGIKTREELVQSIINQYETERREREKTFGAADSIDKFIKPAAKADPNKRTEEQDKTFKSLIDTLKDTGKEYTQLSKTMGLTENATKSLNLAAKAAEALSLARSDAEKEEIKTLTEKAQLQLALNGLAEQDLANKDRAKELIDTIDDGQRQYNETLSEYNELRANGYITDEQYLKLMEKLQVANAKLLTDTEKWNLAIEQGLKNYQNQFANTYENMVALTEKAFKAMEDAIFNFVKGGETNFRELAGSFLDELLRMEIRLLMSEVFGMLGYGQPMQRNQSLMGSGMSMLMGGGQQQMQPQMSEDMMLKQSLIASGNPLTAVGMGQDNGLFGDMSFLGMMFDGMHRKQDNQAEIYKQMFATQQKAIEASQAEVAGKLNLMAQGGGSLGGGGCGCGTQIMEASQQQQDVMRKWAQLDIDTQKDIADTMIKSGGQFFANAGSNTEWEIFNDVPFEQIGVEGIYSPWGMDMSAAGGMNEWDLFDSANFDDISAAGIGVTDSFGDLSSSTTGLMDSFGGLGNSLMSGLSNYLIDPVASAGKMALDWGMSFFSPFAKGGVPNAAGLGAYSNSVVSKPTIFPFAQGGAFGLMGEAGSEAIMPLTRTSNGDLGVKAADSDSGGSKSPFNIINIIDPAMVRDYLKSSDGESTIINVIGRNSQQINSVLG